LRQERSAGSRAQLLPPEEPSRGARQCIVLRFEVRTSRDARRRYVRCNDGKCTSEPLILLTARESARTILIRQPGRAFAAVPIMPTNQDLARKTVPDAATGFRDATGDAAFSTRSPQEQRLLTRVRQALVSAGVDTGHLTIDVVQDRVNVTGLVANHDELVRVPDLIRDLEGVLEVYDVLQVGELT